MARKLQVALAGMLWLLGEVDSLFLRLNAGSGCGAFGKQNGLGWIHPHCATILPEVKIQIYNTNIILY